MAVGIIGGSSSGIYAALFLKRRNPDLAVHLFDRNAKLGKKLYATGNGRCNLINRGVSASGFSHPEFVGKFFDQYGFKELEEALLSLGIDISYLGELGYPSSFSASEHVHLLEKLLQKENVIIHLNENVLSYGKEGGYILKTDKGSYHFDSLIIASGGNSGKNLGTDGTFFKELARHGYQIATLRPGLCPIRTKEKSKSLSGVRHEAKATVFVGGEPIHEEAGELLFKDDGLSGIMIFNCASILARGYHKDAVVRIDLFPGLSEAQLEQKLTALQAINPGFFLDALFTKELQQFLLQKANISLQKPLQASQISSFAKLLKSLDFHFAGLYPFDASQVTVGGVDVSEVDEHLESKKEKGVYFIGEVLDVDGLCGGYNLSWALASALVVGGAL